MPSTLDRFSASDVRCAKPKDARGIAEAYTAAWESHYAELGGEKPENPLQMVDAQEIRFKRMIENQERRVLVVTLSQSIAGFVSFG